MSPRWVVPQQTRSEAGSVSAVVGAMRPVLLLVFLSVGADGFRARGQGRFRGSYAWGPDLVLDPDLSAVFRRVDPRFLSVTIDASLASEERFMLLLRSQKIRTLAKALSPAFLRFGGTSQDFMVFNPQRSRQLDTDESCSNVRLPWWLESRLKEDWALQQQILIKEQQQRKYRRVHFTELTVDMLHSFTSCSGLELIFGLNALLRTANNSWNSSNALSLLQYCESKQYNMSWELGNEPNSYEKKAGIRVDGYQLGLDFDHLRQMMLKSKLYQNAGLYGPDVGQPRGHRVDLLKSFLQSGAEAVDACTWHHYYVNGRDTSLKDFLDPGVLDTLALKINEVLQTVKQVSPGKSVWLGETSSAFGGGAAGLSDTFAAGFMWLDKLGLAAKLGLDIVMRQVLVGSGSYHMIDDELDPLPDYWLSVLYKRLVGPEVLQIQTVSGFGRSKRVRLYLHCANKKSYTRGSVVLISMNLSKKMRRISVPALASSSTVEAFVLQSYQPGEEGLGSRLTGVHDSLTWLHDRLRLQAGRHPRHEVFSSRGWVKLNRAVLKMVDDKTLPDLGGVRLPPAEHLQLPAYSLAFFVFLDAQAVACH